MKFKNNIEAEASIILDGTLTDAGGSPGSVNQLLSSTVTGTTWIDPSTIVAEAATVVVIACKNTSGAIIAKGTPVYQTGTVGATATIEIAPADALISTGDLPAIGLLQTALNNNGFGFVVISGALTNFTTSPIDGVVPVTGDKVFLKSGGGLTLTKPTGSENGIQNLGLIGKVAIGSAGTITVSSIMRTNDVPNLPEGRIWVGDGNTIVSDTVYVDEPNNRVGIGTAGPSSELEIAKPNGFSTLTLSSAANISYGGGGIMNIKGGIYDYTSFALNVQTANGTQEASMGYSAGSGRTWAFDANQRGVTSGGHTSYNFKNNGSSQMVIYNNNLGIGTTSPQEKLTVNGAISAITSDYVQGTTGSRLLMHSAGTGNSHSYIQAQRSGGTSNAEDLALQLYGGNVGIGTHSPSVKLEVEGDGIFNGSVVINKNTETLRLGTTETGGGTYQTWHNASGRKGFFGYGSTVNDIISLVNEENSTIQLGTNGRTADFIVSADGNIGLGITSPGVKLVTIAQNYSEGPTLGSGVVGGQALLATNGLFGQYSGVSETTGHVWHQVQRNDNTTAYNMILQPAGGNVGIGTDSPGDKLVVQGDGDGILVRSNDFTLSRIIPRGGTSTNWDKALFSLYNAATESVRIDTAGNSWFNGGFVGIGVTSPGHKLHVENTVGSSWTTRFSNTVANSNNIYFGYNSGTISYGMYIDGGQGAAGYDIQTASGFVVRGDGKVGIGLTNPGKPLDVSGAGRFTSTLTATNFILSSDERLKTNIKEIETNHIDVNWKNFELKSEPGVKRAGVIAQELEEKHPEFVRTDDEGMKSVAYIDLLIAKIAELEARLEKAGI